MTTIVKILRLTAKLLIVTAPLMLLSGLFTANPHLLGDVSPLTARFMHTAAVPAFFVPLLAIHSIMGILFLIMRNKNLNRTWVKAAAVSLWSVLFVVFGSLYFSSSAKTSEKSFAQSKDPADIGFYNAAAPAIAPVSSPEGEPGQKKPSVDGKTVVESKCSTCHGLDFVHGKKRSAEEWRSVVLSMQKKGAGLTEKEVEAAIDYLAKPK